MEGPKAAGEASGGGEGGGDGQAALAADPQDHPEPLAANEDVGEDEGLHKARPEHHIDLSKLSRLW